MFGSTVLEVATGLVFVFLLVALICSQIGNKVSEVLNWRARDLEAGLRDLLLGKHQALLHKVYESPYVQQANIVASPIMQWVLKSPLQGLVFTHIKSGAESVLGPINLNAQEFGLALFDAIVPGTGGQSGINQWREGIKNMPDMPLKKALLPIAESVDKGIDDALARVGEWFNHAEDQMTFIYRQHMWQFAVTIGVLISVFFNIDSIAIGDRLWHDQALRDQVNAAAKEYASKSVETFDPKDQTKSKQYADAAKSELDKLNLPIGWQITSGQQQILGVPLPQFTPNDWLQTTRSTTPLGQLRDALAKIIGWLITGFAGAQGAPFWFDILKRLTQRNAPSPS